MIPEKLSAIFEDAIRTNAPDLHFESASQIFQVRKRAPDGLQTVYTERDCPLIHPFERIISQLAGFSTAIGHPPEDGRFSLSLPTGKATFRASKIPTVNGSSIVLRMLKPPLRNATLEQLHCPVELIQSLEASISKQDGLLIFAGPTGSGKTTTIYALLESIPSPKPKLLTVEDPVEYDLPFATQSSVNLSNGWSFPIALKHFLRQDPDIIFIGEIREEETASLALRAALTGHLVLASTHASDPTGILHRMKGWNISSALLQETVSALVAQRLVPALCPLCSKEPDKALKHESIPVHLARLPNGCQECRFTGFLNKIPLFSWLIPENMDVLHMMDSPENDVQSKAWRTFEDTISAKIKEGRLGPVQAIEALS